MVVRLHIFERAKSRVVTAVAGRLRRSTRGRYVQSYRCISSFNCAAAYRTCRIFSTDRQNGGSIEPRRLLSGLPAGFQEADIGTVGLAGSSSYNSSSGVFTVKGAGDDLFGSTDAFHFVYTTLTGNGSFAAHVTSVTATNTSAPSGLDVRSSLSPTAANVFDAVQAGGSNIINARTTDGGVGNALEIGGTSAPYLLEIIRTGDVISCYISTNNGVAYGLQQQVTLPGLGNSMVVGFAVASHDPTQLATATFDHEAIHSFTAPPANIQEADIGVVGAAGFTDYDSATGTFAVTGAGSDLYGPADAFHYDYTTLSGDGSFTVRVTSVSAFAGSAPSGIALRHKPRSCCR